MNNSTLVLFFTLAISLVNAQEQPKDTLEWEIFLSGNRAGFLKQWANSDGSLSEWFQYNDRGRGDSTVAKYRYNDLGFIEHLRADGVNYYKKPVFEKFDMEGKSANWENSSEKGRKELNEPAGYIAVDISVGTSFERYFRTADQNIDLLPTGSSKLSILDSFRLDNGKIIRLVSTMGSGMTPSYSWIDDKNEFFAAPGTWFSQFKKGYQHLNETLLKIQDGHKDGYYEDIKQRLERNIDGVLAMTNANLFNPATGKITPNTTILIENDRIKDVLSGPYRPDSKHQVLDLEGKFVMPGLWDMHVHYGNPSQGLLNLGCGVTNVRDMGNGKDLLDRIEQINNGSVLGPRIQSKSGFIDGAGEYAGPIGEKITSVEEGREAVRQYAELGYEQIKLYSSIEPEWVAPITSEARKLNLRVSGHVPAHMLASEAIDAGYDEIQHVNMLFLNFYGKELDTRTPVRFTAVAEKAADFDFESKEFKGFLEKLKSHGTTIDPTVSIFEGMFTGQKGQANPVYEKIIERLPLNTQRFFKTGPSLETPEGMRETYTDSFHNMLKMVKLLFDNGIPIVPGTDAFAGFTLHRELENYVRAGIPSEEVLKMATLSAATLIGKENKFGTIEKGKVADIIVVDGNPLENISDIRKIETVIKDGSYYSTEELLATLSVSYFK